MIKKIIKKYCFEGGKLDFLFKMLRGNILLRVFSVYTSRVYRRSVVKVFIWCLDLKKELKFVRLIMKM